MNKTKGATPVKTNLSNVSEEQEPAVLNITLEDQVFPPPWSCGTQEQLLRQRAPQLRFEAEWELDGEPDLQKATAYSSGWFRPQAVAPIRPKWEAVTSNKTTNVTGSGFQSPKEGKGPTESKRATAMPNMSAVDVLDDAPSSTATSTTLIPVKADRRHVWNKNPQSSTRAPPETVHGGGDPLTEMPTAVYGLWTSRGIRLEEENYNLNVSDELRLIGISTHSYSYSRLYYALSIAHCLYYQLLCRSDTNACSVHL